jgi:mono/diheme cytochrome c family protein
VRSFPVFTFILWCLWSPIGAAGFDLLDRVPVGSSHVMSPYSGDSRTVRAGAKLYQRECASCHGEQGIKRAPRLDSPRVKDAMPGTLFWVLRNGSLRRGMPSFAHLPEAQRWQIVSFLKSRTE